MVLPRNFVPSGLPRRNFNLKFERRKAGVRPGEICERSGLARSTIRRFKNGDSDFRIATLEQYRDALDKKLNLISKDAEQHKVTMGNLGLMP